MRFSLVLATVGRTDELKRFLASLDTQRHPDFELIVADQNPDSRLTPILKPYNNRFTILHLHSPVSLSKARNVGLQHITGDVVAFPDDDCRYPPGLFERIMQAFSQHPSAAGVTGCTVNARNEMSEDARFDKTEGFVSLPNVWRRANGNSIFFWRDIVAAIGDFDETLGLGPGVQWEGGEDIDYTVRAIKAGFRIYYSPDICVLHQSAATGNWSKMSKRAYRYGAGIGRVWRKHNFPLWLVGYQLLRPLGGSLLSVMVGHLPKARYHWDAFRGRLRGWRSGLEAGSRSGWHEPGR